MILAVLVGCTSQPTDESGGPADPVAALADSVQGFEDADLAIRLAASGPAEISVTSWPVEGTLVGEPPELVYRPAPNFHGHDQLVFEASADGVVSEAVVAIEVLPVDDLPEGSDLAVTTDEDVSVDGSLAATDIDGDTLTFQLVTLPTRGIASVDRATGVFIYTPDLDFFGADAFEWSASTESGDSGVQTVSLEVAPVNDAPVALDQLLAGVEDEALVATALATDADGDVLTFTLFVPPDHGEASLDESGAFAYTPDPDFAGADQVLFTVSDGALDSAPAALDLEIAGIDDPPYAAPLALACDEDGVAVGVISASDLEVDLLAFTLATPPGFGVATVDPATGAVQYTPSPDANGADAFLVEVSAGLSSAFALVSVDVAPVNDAPVAFPVAFAGTSDQPIHGSFSALDVDGDPLTFSLASLPALGEVTPIDGAAFVYVPDPEGAASVAFTYAASDGFAVSAPATVVIEVELAPAAPVAVDVAVRLVGTTPAEIHLSGSDPNGDPVTFAVVTSPSHADLSIVGDVAHLVAHPGLGAAEVASFEARDPGGLADLGAIAITYDTDADGLDDDEEVALGTDPLVFDADTDTDGLVDAVEASEGTDPADPDTDGDGVSDGWEYRFGLDPRVDESGACEVWTETEIVSFEGGRARPADMDGDGDVDVVVGVTFEAEVDWVANLGGGVFGARTEIGFVQLVRDVGAADFDLDGDFDVAAAGEEDDEVVWFENVGGGVFGTQLDISGAVSGAHEIAIGDFDADGDPDLVATGGGDGEIEWFPNLVGDFALTQRIDTAGDATHGVDAADLTGDGLVDVLAVRPLDEIVEWFENLGGGAFGPRQILTQALEGGESVRAADLDADGDLDVLAAGFDLVWFENLGGGVFSQGILIAEDVSELVGGHVGAGDVDGDGEMDALLTSAVPPGNWWYPRVARGGVEARLVGSGEGWGYSVELTDLDEDGAGDLLVGYSRSVAWYRLPISDPDGLSDAVELCITGTDPTSWDTDGGGVSDAAEVSALTDPLDPGDDGPPVDSDGDGLLDGDEIEVWSSDLYDPDTDGDGVIDGAEVAGGTDPLLDDTDGDGLADGAEAAVGADPTNPDTDGDHLPDGAELALGTDLAVADPDADADGAIDALELAEGTDPANADTDGDGLSDGAELVDWATDPLRTDTDGDTVPDGAEALLLGTDPTFDESEACAELWVTETVPTSLSTVLGLAASDVDLDGDDDLLVTGSTPDRVGWYANDGGQFGPLRIVSSLPITPLTVEGADLDGDGDPELLVSSALDDTISWFPNFGGGVFGARVIVTSALDYARSATVGDLDRDGDLDLVASGSYDLGWYENLGAGAFGPATALGVAGAGAEQVALADLDGDLDLDVAAASLTASSWSENLGGGVFAPAVLLATGHAAEAIRAADLDADGDLDLVLSSDVAGVVTLTNDGAGGFGAPVGHLDAEIDVRTIGVADFEGDGFPDVVYHDVLDLFWLSNVAGSLAPPVWIEGSLASYALLTLDVDVDGAPDVLVGGVADDVSVHLNRVRPGDADGLSDAGELCVAGTDPQLDDTDGGGVDDRTELLGLGDPLDSSDD